MGRKTVYNAIFTTELYDQVSKENKEILKEFMEYLRSTDKSPQTIYQYENDIRIFLIWNLQNNNNKFFVDFSKRDVMRFQSYMLNELKHSPNRVRRLKASISSMANFVEGMMDDLYPQFRNIINKIPAPVKQAVREKTILSSEQVQQILDYLVENKRYQLACVFALAAASGSRKAELLRFKVSYFTNENIKFGALYKTPEMMKTKGRGSMGKMLYRYVLVSRFKPYLDLWMNERKELGIDGEDLFVVKHGDEWLPATESTISNWADSIGKILDVDFYFHSMRHFFTTELCKNNIPADVIKDIIGWSSTALIDVYNDSEVDDELGKYFDASGIKETEKKVISDIK